MRESELLEGNRFVRGIKKIHDRLFAMVRLHDQLTPAHVTLAVALSLDLSRHRKACLIPISRLLASAAIEWPSFTQRCWRSHIRTIGEWQRLTLYVAASHATYSIQLLRQFVAARESNEAH